MIAAVAIEVTIETPERRVVVSCRESPRSDREFSRRAQGVEIRSAGSGRTVFGSRWTIRSRGAFAARNVNLKHASRRIDLNANVIFLGIDDSHAAGKRECAVRLSELLQHRKLSPARRSWRRVIPSRVRAVDWRDHIP